MCYLFPDTKLRINLEITAEEWQNCEFSGNAPVFKPVNGR